MPANATPSFSRASTLTSRLPALLLSALLTSCSSMTGTVPTPVPKVSAPEQCLLLAETPLPLVEPTLAGAVRNHVAAMQQYWELAERHRCLAEFERNR